MRTVHVRPIGARRSPGRPISVQEHTVPSGRRPQAGSEPGWRTRKRGIPYIHSGPISGLRGRHGPIAGDSEGSCCSVQQMGAVFYKVSKQDLVLNLLSSRLYNYVGRGTTRPNMLERAPLFSVSTSRESCTNGYTGR